MNIGNMIRGLLGDSKPGAAKALELKEGQVVRGVVLSVSDTGKEALVQIQGTPVRAELTTPLLPGETLNLQVGPSGEGGLPVLKPVSLGDTALVTSQNMGEALESLGLTNSKAGREIVLAMQAGGIPLTKENAAMLEKVMSAKPANVPTSEWLEAAAISLKRGLPVTAESVKGLQQAVFGPQLHQLLSALEDQITIWAGKIANNDTVATGSQSGNITPTDLPDASVKAGTGAVINLGAAVEGNTDTDAMQPLGKGNGQLGSNTLSDVDTGQPITVKPGEQGLQSKVSATASQVSSAETDMIAGKPLILDETGEGVQGLKNTTLAESAAGKTTSTIANGAMSSALAAEADIMLNKPASSAEAQHQNAAVKLNADGAPEDATNVNKSTLTNMDNSVSNGGTTAGAASQAAAPSGAALLAKLQGVLSELRGSLPQLAVVPPADAAGQDPAPAAIAPRGETPAATASPAQPHTAPPADAESWVGRVLKLLGAEHEQQAVRGGANAAAETARAATGTAAQSLQGIGGDKATDTLKGVLLQMMSSSEVPPALKDAAGALVQQLTGQQLLLNTDRTTPFAQVTLFLPLEGPDGQETASVHIQSRRGRKGELDAANCRLWFDLDMKMIGQTLVDVHVVDRMVSLKLHNDQPWVLELLEERREDVKTAVESIGYQLSGLRTEPLPELKPSTDLAGTPISKLVDYVPDAYKGVDYRI